MHWITILKMSSVDHSESSPRTSKRGPWRRTSDDYKEGISIEDVQLGALRKQVKLPFIQSRLAIVHHLAERRRSKTLVTWLMVLFILCVAGYCFSTMAALSSLVNSFLSSIRKHYYPENHLKSVISYPRTFLQVNLEDRRYLNAGSASLSGGKLHVNKEVLHRPFS